MDSLSFSHLFTPLQVTCGYIQIYQEKIYDLLNSNQKMDLNVREDPILGECNVLLYGNSLHDNISEHFRFTSMLCLQENE